MRVIPIFPLELVVLEQEELRLHIFEPRYKKLIKEGFAQKFTFGIPAVIDKKLTGSGAEVELIRLERTYENGEMDIVCKVVSRFSIVEVFPARELNVASSASVETLPYEVNSDKELDFRLFDLLQEFYHLSDIQPPGNFDKEAEMLAFAHKCGLSLIQEEELASLQSSGERQLYLLNHLKHMVQVLTEIKRMKKLVQLNGHFKKLSQSF